MKKIAIIFLFIIPVLSACQLYPGRYKTEIVDKMNTSSSGSTNTYTLTYDSGGAASGNVPTDGNLYHQGAAVSIQGNTGGLIDPGYAFAGWTTSITGPGSSYSSGATLSMGSSNITLYAVWITNSLKFNSSETNITITGTNSSPGGILIIPCGVTTIGGSAFYCCISFTSVTIPASVISVGINAFQTCESLISINVDSANSFYESISGILFNKNGTTLVEMADGMNGSYIIPSGVISISGSAFQNCSLTSITIPSGVTNLGAGGDPFMYCNNLISINVDTANTSYKSISGILFGKDGTTLVAVPGSMTDSYIIPSGVLSINGGAFDGCGIVSVNIPSSVTNIGNNGVYGDPFNCRNLLSINVDSANTFYESINGVLFNKSGTVLISVPGSMTGSYIIPSGVLSINGGSFQWGFLTSVIIPSSVTNIGDGAFYSCTSLTSLTVQATIPPALPSGSQVFDNCNPGLLIHVPSGTVLTYQTATGWSDYASLIVSP